MGPVSAELGRRIYLDTNIVIYVIEGYAQYAAQVQALLDAMDAGEVSVVTSELTLAEVLVGPLKTGDVAIQQTYRSFLTSTATVEIPLISRDILEEAAQLRVNTKLKLPDAIHLATSLRFRCDSFLTNDDIFRTLGLPQIKMLADVSLT